MSEEQQNPKVYSD